MISVILNALSCPVTIVMNVLVIAAVKTRHRLRSNYNILLACLAGTDLLGGIACQPSFIVGQIYVIKGVSLNEYCQDYKATTFIFVIPVTASLFHLTLLSIERFVAMKYTLRYTTIVTTRRITVAVLCSWFIACFPAILPLLSDKFETIVRVTRISLRCLNISLIIFCHLSVYFVTRRHEKQIKSELISQQAIADFEKEKKALKTTRIILITLLVCNLPMITFVLFLNASSNSSSDIVHVITLSHPIFVFSFLINSLCNPIIYCYRNKTFRKTCKELLKMNCTNSNNEE